MKLILYRHPKSKMVGWPDVLDRNYNGSRTPCDMLEGPCCCGAWHQPGEFTGDFEIRDLPADASRQLRVEVCGIESVLFDEANARFKEYLKLFKLPDIGPSPEGLMVEFLENLIESIRQSAVKGARFVRVPLPKGFGYKTGMTEWLAASGYQTNWTDLELTILW